MAGIVAYFRVSTKRQGVSGLGLEGQAAAVEAYAKQTGKPIVAVTVRRIRTFRRIEALEALTSIVRIRLAY